ncbi:MAG: acyl carrier protein [Actinoplanes sp.]
MAVTTAYLEGWLVERLAEYLEIDADEIEPDEEVVRYGVDSLAKASLGAEIEDVFGVRLEQEFFLDHRTVESIAAGLNDQIAAKA